MAKIFDSSPYIIDMVEEACENAGITSYGLNIRVLSLAKAKDVVKVGKANATTEFITKKDSMIYVFVYEAVFERLDEAAQRMLIDMAISNIFVDTEKDKVIIESNPYVQVFNMRKKYGEPFLNALEYSYDAVKQIEEEDRQRKEAEKQAKKDKKNKKD